MASRPRSNPEVVSATGEKATCEAQPFAGELKPLQAVFELMGQEAFIVDAWERRILDANPAACKYLNCGRASLVGRSWSDIAFRFPQANLRRVDEHRLVAVVDRSVPDVQHRDSLTGLANREAFRSRVSHHVDVQSARLALLFIDLDGFKEVNDRWGHVTGDGVLQVIARRLSESVRPGDMVVRYGGDEFLVLVEDVGRRRDLERLARRIQRAVHVPIVIEGHRLVVSASIGMARRSRSTPTIESLVHAADRDMYRAKQSQRSNLSELAKAKALKSGHLIHPPSGLSPLSSSTVRSWSGSPFEE
jgi:diguanylate cyclase (GGDEF)-like protein